jgi:hypothetical protein
MFPPILTTVKDFLLLIFKYFFVILTVLHRFYYLLNNNWVFAIKDFVGHYYTRLTGKQCMNFALFVKAIFSAVTVQFDHLLFGRNRYSCSSFSIDKVGIFKSFILSYSITESLVIWIQFIPSGCDYKISILQLHHFYKRIGYSLW